AIVALNRGEALKRGFVADHPGAFDVAAPGEVEALVAEPDRELPFQAKRRDRGELGFSAERLDVLLGELVEVDREGDLRRENEREKGRETSESGAHGCRSSP